MGSPGQRTRYDSVAMTLHWVIALLIVLDFVLALSFSQFNPGDTLYLASAYDLHMSTGASILALSVVRVAWRLTHRRPPLPQMGRVLGGLARTSHFLLYVFMIAAPLSGWLVLSLRHQATSVVIASQDPLSVPRAVIELTSILLLHRMTSPQWLKHLKSAISALEGVTESQVAALKPGEALLWAQRSTDVRFTQRPQKVTIRPRFTQHGGGTKTAVAGQTVR